jgi:hypothetical protein
MYGYDVRKESAKALKELNDLIDCESQKDGSSAPRYWAGLQAWMSQVSNCMTGRSLEQ